MREHLPVLLVVVPLMAAPVCVVVRHLRLVHLLSVAVTWTAFAIAVLLLVSVRDDGTISYALGGWPPPWGIEYRVDLTNAFVLLLVSAIAAVVAPVAPGRRDHSLDASREYLFHASFLLCLAGLLGVTITGDAFNTFVLLEIASLGAYVLVSVGRRRQALRAAFAYLIMGTVGGTFYLIGIGFAYQMTGTLNMADLAVRLPAVDATRTVHAAFAFLSVGLAIKIAVFPLHQWLPGAYAEAPSTVSAFLAGTATKVAYYLLLRMTFTVFGAAYVFGKLRLDLVLLPLSLVAIVVGPVAAIYQKDFRRLLAYSSISQVGYMTVGLCYASPAGLTGGLVHVFGHGLTKAGLFLVAACVVCSGGSTTIDCLRGIGRRMPLTGAALVVGGLGLVGVPATTGFVAKWYLVSAALEKGHLAIALVLLFGSLLTAVYVWRLVEIAYFKEAGEDAPKCEAPWRMVVPTWLLLGATVYFGIFTDLPVGVASAAAAELLGATP